MDKQFKNYNLPDERGHFEKFGGKFVPESLIPALEELEHYYTEAKQDDSFQNELNELLKHYSAGNCPLFCVTNIRRVGL